MAKKYIQDQALAEQIIKQNSKWLKQNAKIVEETDKKYSEIIDAIKDEYSVKVHFLEIQHYFADNEFVGETIRQFMGKDKLAKNDYLELAVLLATVDRSNSTKEMLKAVEYLPIGNSVGLDIIAQNIKKKDLNKKQIDLVEKYKSIGYTSKLWPK